MIYGLFALPISGETNCPARFVRVLGDGLKKKVDLADVLYQRRRLPVNEAFEHKQNRLMKSDVRYLHQNRRPKAGQEYADVVFFIQR